MGKIITYNNPDRGNANQCFCQIQFESGERILISQARNGIKIIRLLFGFIPIKTIFRADYYDNTHEIFMNSEESYKYLLDYYVDTVVSFKSINELKNHINTRLNPVKPRF